MKFNFKEKLLWLAAVIFFDDHNSGALANPTGLTVTAGSASAQQIGSQLNLTVSQLAILNWQSFNIGKGQTTSFLQPSSSSVVFNEIGSANPSKIFGNLNANGTVILANANGFYFGPNSMINIGGSFIATTAPLPPDLGAGASWQFTGMPPTASIINYGRIQVGSGKSLYLIGENVDNHGSLEAPGGDIGLYAGESVLVSESADGRGLSATVKVPGGSVNNFGQITADAGTIALQAQVVNQNGVIQADSIQNNDGVIELVASDELNLGAGSQITANGGGSVGGSAGGKVVIQSGNDFSDVPGSRISVAGGERGGNGGSIEISAPNIASLCSSIDAGAAAGWNGGAFTLDPENIVLGTSGTSSGGTSGTINGTGSSGTLDISVNTAFQNVTAGSVLLEASGDITLNPNTIWNLSSSTGKTAGQLTLEAGGDIIFGNKSEITDANDWGVSLYAGYSFANNAVQSGIGNIYLNGGAGLTGNGTIQLSAGDINLFAGESILVSPLNSQVVSGSVFTTGGGSIFAYAAAGDIVAGTSNGGNTSNGQTSDYRFTSTGATPNPYLGGISTEAGGNVTLIAGDDIDSAPIVPANQAPGASGAYGSGSVTVIAGNQITGNYTLANGVGTMLAGVAATSAQAADLQDPIANPSTYATALDTLIIAVRQSQNANGNIGSAPVAGSSSTEAVRLSLISGSWNAWAANDISIKEVDNPNGAFNTQTFAYNYAADAVANFWAGNAIELVGANLQRQSNSKNQTPIYAPDLSLNAGAGGIKIDTAVILAPSSEGSLRILTRDGGNLTGAVTSGSSVLAGITMSDSSSSNYKTFASEQDNIYLGTIIPRPVVLDISGSIGSFSLNVPTFADITVQGTAPFATPESLDVYGTYNFGFQGRNLSPVESTSVNVTGDIIYSASQTASLGLSLVGPGKFSVSADEIDLGVSSGISVQGPDADLGLAAIYPYGSDLSVNVSSDLKMTSSEIVNDGYLGSINVIAGGALDVGGGSTAVANTSSSSSPEGIFTTSGGNVTVQAVGDVNVDGSRIAAYDGGNISVESLNGDVNAGNGGEGYVSFKSWQLDQSGQLTPIAADIPLSGILATTIVGSDASLGNITINALTGNVNANLGGIFQLAFNGNSPQDTFVQVNAGKDIDAGSSGIIGSAIKLQAGGSINGLIIGSQSVNINSAQNVDVTAFSGGDVSINAAGTVSGTVLGGSVDVSGDSITASLISGSISTSGDTAGATIGVPQSNVQQAVAQTADNATAATSKLDDSANDGSDDDDKKKKGKGISLAQRVSRVTVLLPTKD